MRDVGDVTAFAGDRQVLLVEFLSLRQLAALPVDLGKIVQDNALVGSEAVVA